MKKNILILIVGLALGLGAYTLVKVNPIKISNAGITLQQNKIETKTIIKEKSDIVDVVKKVGPSVVSIAVKRSVRVGSDPFGLFNNDSSLKQSKESGIGTGFIVSADGTIVTNRHVVETQGSYIVITNDNKKYDVKKVTLDQYNDFAILKIDAAGLTPIEFGDSSAIDVGQTVVAMGNALGEFKNTVTVGVVSGVDRQIEASDQGGQNSEKLGNVIQTDAAINPGNSGGPLLNIGGQVIGINTAVAATGNAQNIGFAIPVNSVKPVLNEYLATGKISRPYIGVRFQMVSKRIAIINDISEGAYIMDVIEGGPADMASLKADDIISEIEGKKVTGDTPLSDVIRQFKPNQVVTIKYFRDGEEKSTQLTIGDAGEQ